jgi:hypothetical protein
MFGIAGLAVFAVVGVATGASKDSNGSNVQANSNTTDTRTCPSTDFNMDGDTLAFSGSTVLWPPNHKMRTVYVTATDVDNNPTGELSDSTSLSTTVTSNEPLNGPGDGNTPVDFTAPQMTTESDGTVTHAINLRGERAGKDPLHVFDGRTYTIHAMATYDGNPMDSCTQDFTVRVPHDMGHG